MKMLATSSAPEPLTLNIEGVRVVVEFEDEAGKLPVNNFAAGDSDFATTQAATNAMLKVDGFPTAGYEYIQRSTNSISDVLAMGVEAIGKLPGLSFELRPVGVFWVSLCYAVVLLVREFRGKPEGGMIFGLCTDRPSRRPG